MYYLTVRLLLYFCYYYYYFSLKRYHCNKFFIEIILTLSLLDIPIKKGIKIGEIVYEQTQDLSNIHVVIFVL